MKQPFIQAPADPIRQRLCDCLDSVTTPGYHDPNAVTLKLPLNSDHSLLTNKIPSCYSCPLAHRGAGRRSSSLHSWGLEIIR